MPRKYCSQGESWGYAPSGRKVKQVSNEPIPEAAQSAKSKGEIQSGSAQVRVQNLSRDLSMGKEGVLGRNERKRNGK